MNTRRQFSSSARRSAHRRGPASCTLDGTPATAQPAGVDTGCAADLRHGRWRRPGRDAGHLRRRKAHASDHDAGRAGRLPAHGAHRSRNTSSDERGRERSRSRTPTSPAALWNPMLPEFLGPAHDTPVRSSGDAHAAAGLGRRHRSGRVAPVTQLARWIFNRGRSLELNHAHLSRSLLERLAAKIRSVITVTKDHAIARARQADGEIAAGQHRGPLHGVPYGREGSARHEGHPHDARSRAPFRNRASSRQTPSPCGG